jgi:replicative DNA helicase
VPIIALSQLSRQVEARDDKRPQLSDLRESGSIEQDADIVMFVYREPYYLMREKPNEGTEEFMLWQERMNLVDGTAEVIIGKNRHGPTGTAKMAFEDRFTRFTDLIEDDRLPERFD